MQITAALGGVVALLYTARNYRLARHGQVTDRFTKALERLDSEQMYVRLGGVVALEQIVQDSPGQAPQAALVLNAFIRDRAPRTQPKQRPASKGELGAAALRTALEQTTRRREIPLGMPEIDEIPEADVQAALTALTCPASRLHADRTQPISLEYLHLKGADLCNADLTGAVLCGADLTHAVLGGADLRDANFSSAVLVGTILSDARLYGAAFHDAILTGADFHSANLAGADFDGAIDLHRTEPPVTHPNALGVDIRAWRGSSGGIG
ncbi:pentapeptide repeat-containing protein [Streptomyces malaysiensis subsp. malaysiensis]|uniref:Pentapeptide repeat-containing protein n=1 Tax=Streptomyces malaysiensis TaxID=92644 RepID=A0ABX6WBW5_STRMQ|nr:MULTISPECIES: pentapeptide repeat-containing protein [Streptomyces]QPI57341.1 pentapeptide repeat-containing protein [Streptomyces solisilvae]UHH18888.1 pentapeptide repeat-containing protein [Streptomyces sp. HNM0561]